ncbi:hypothetical protein [Roseibium sp.]|uniref:hypothetical protein n=1 Tax=Roseibium sp. TaxID=1936156 RepID=UPI003D0FE77E
MTSTDLIFSLLVTATVGGLSTAAFGAVLVAETGRGLWVVKTGGLTALMAFLVAWLS